MAQHTVLESTLEVFRRHGVTKIFGNPGSNEIPFLAGLTEDFDFILGLHEQVVVGMAEGYSRATGKPALVNLHAASGSGNAMGALTNARYGHVPLVILAGQQVRRTVGQEVMLGSADASILPAPLVKYSHEPLAAEDVPRTLSQAFFEAETQPRGPVYVSVPLDDWALPALDDDKLLAGRSVRAGATPDPESLAEVTSALNSSRAPAIVLGPQVDAAAVDDPEIFGAAVRLAEKTDASVFVAPSPSRAPFPTRHPNYKGVLVPSIRSVRDRLAKHDLVLVVGAGLFRYHRWEPSNYLTAGTTVFHLTQDPREASRAPFGTSLLTEVGAALTTLAETAEDQGKRRPREREKPQRTPEGETDETMTGTQLLEVLNTHLNETVAYVNETTTLDLDYLERIVIDRPGMYHFPASGGLGFGIPAAVGMSLGAPDKTIVATVGDGSLHYGVSALYTAAQRRTRTVFVIVNNSGYGALKGFSRRMGAVNMPGLDVKGIDVVAIAEGYGVPAQRVSTLDDFDHAYREALESEGPVLIDAHVS
ncbi:MULTISPECIES: benzoylformate decarboxylase [Actinomycetes]|uniref:Benzoylformate decarboxylase n=2 Tax=Actinomycetes TaxID=1760 RepID=A0ABP6LRY1_9MICC